MLRYEIVDVFTDTAFAGNPLAVVLDGEDLTRAQMQSLAREFHLSETAFPLPSVAADYRLRIFTPDTELPFAGHPSLGSAHTLARLGRIAMGNVTQECRAGLLPLEVGRGSATLTGGAAVLGDVHEGQPLAQAVGLDADDLAPVAPHTAGCGLDFCYLPVRADAVARAVPDGRALAALAAAGNGGMVVFGWDGQRREAHVRVFGAAVGVVEDPATGSAALGLGVFLVGAGLLPVDGSTTYTVHQGAEVLRPSTLRCSVTARGGDVTAVTVSGGVVPVASGTIRRP